MHQIVKRTSGGTIRFSSARRRNDLASFKTYLIVFVSALFEVGGRSRAKHWQKLPQLLVQFSGTSGDDAACANIWQLHNFRLLEKRQLCNQATTTCCRRSVKLLQLDSPNKHQSNKTKPPSFSPSPPPLCFAPLSGFNSLLFANS